MDIFKIVALGVVASILTILIKQIKPEFYVTVLISSSVLLLIYILQYLSSIFSLLDTIVERTGIDRSLFAILIKIIGVGYLVEFGAGLCEDSGNSSIASKVVLAGKIAIFVLAIPIITTLFNLIIGLL